MEAAQKDFGDHEGNLQNRGRKEIRPGPDSLPGLQDQGGRPHPNGEKTDELLVSQPIQVLQESA